MAMTPRQNVATYSEGYWFDTEAFPSFAPLLIASDSYARQSGCRFRSSSFDGLDAKGASEIDKASVPVVSAKRSRDAGPRLAAKLSAAPAVRDFAKRLNESDPRLDEELRQAFQLTVDESIRSTMISVCKQYGMFPPVQAPNLHDEDCDYSIAPASVPEVAQRLYNSEVRRLSECTRGVAVAARRAKTAAYIVEFAEESGFALPCVPEQGLNTASEFQKRAEMVWGSDLDGLSSARASSSSPDAGADVLGRVGSWWSENKEGILFTAGAVAAGAIAIAASQSSKPNRRNRARA